MTTSFRALFECSNDGSPLLAVYQRRPDSLSGVRVRDAEGFLLPAADRRATSVRRDRVDAARLSGRRPHARGRRDRREIAETAAGMRAYQNYETGRRNVGRHVLDANPLLSVGNLTRRAGVMVHRHRLPKSEIDRQLADLAARVALR